MHGVGIFIFLAYGTDLNIVKIWLLIFKLIAQGQWRAVKKLVLSGYLSVRYLPSSSESEISMYSL